MQIIFSIFNFGLDKFLMELLRWRLYSFVRLFPQKDLANQTVYFISAEYDKSIVIDDLKSQNFPAFKNVGKSVLVTCQCFGYNVRSGFCSDFDQYTFCKVSSSFEQNILRSIDLEIWLTPLNFSVYLRAGQSLKYFPFLKTTLQIHSTE